MGAGLGNVYAERLGDRYDRWAADKAGFYDAEAVKAAKAKNPDVRWIDTLLGEGSTELPDEHFDLVYSVSVVEHIEPERIAATFDDIVRVLRPGGLSVHSIDVRPGRFDKLMKALREVAPSGRLSWVEAPQQLDFSIPDLMREPLDIVFKYYDKRPELEHKLRVAKTPTYALLFAVRKN